MVSFFKVNKKLKNYIKTYNFEYKFYPNYESTFVFLEKKFLKRYWPLLLQNVKVYVTCHCQGWVIATQTKIQFKNYKNSIAKIQ